MATVSLIHDLPGDLPRAIGLTPKSTIVLASGASEAVVPGQTPAQDTQTGEAPPKPSAAGARQAMENAHAATDGPEKPAPQAQPTPWAQASFLAQHDEHASSLWQDVKPCWKPSAHTQAFQMRVQLDEEGAVLHAEILRDHSVKGLVVDGAAVEGARDALEACSPYTRFAGPAQAYDITFPG